MARPKRGNFATGAEGQARYRKAVQTWLKNKKEAAEKANKITSTQKNIDKQKQPTVKKTKAKPVKELAKKKSTSATKKTSTPKKNTTTKQTVKATTTKKKPTNTTTVKPTNQRLKAAKNLAEKGYKGSKKIVGSAVKQTRKFAEKQAPKVQNWKKTLKAGLRQKNPKAQTGPQKVFQGINQTIRKGRILGKKYLKDHKPFRKALTKGVEAVKADKGRSLVKGGANLTKGFIAYSVADALTKRATAPVTNRILKSVRNARRREVGMKNLTLEESNKVTKDFNKKSKAEQKAILKKEKEFIKEYRANKKKNKDSSNKSLKINKSEDYLGNNKKNKKTSSKTSNNSKPIVRSVGKTDYNIATEGGKKAYEKALHINKSLPSSDDGKYVKAPKKRLTGREKLRQKNIDRFGKPHVVKLRQKNKDFQAMKKKKMTKEEFRKKYPNSITAQRHKGLRK